MVPQPLEKEAKQRGHNNRPGSSSASSRSSQSGRSSTAAVSKKRREKGAKQLEELKREPDMGEKSVQQNSLDSILSCPANLDLVAKEDGEETRVPTSRKTSKVSRQHGSLKYSHRPEVSVKRGQLTSRTHKRSASDTTSVFRTASFGPHRSEVAHVGEAVRNQRVGILLFLHSMPCIVRY